MKITKALSLIGLTLSLLATPLLAKDDIKLVVNGKQVESQIKPIIKDGKTLVPLRTVGDAFGLETKLFDFGNIYSEVSLRNKTGMAVAALSNVKKSELINGTVYVPLREFGEQLMCETINWDAKTNTVTLERKPTFRQKFGAYEQFEFDVRKDKDYFLTSYIDTWEEYNKTKMFLDGASGGPNQGLHIYSGEPGKSNGFYPNQLELAFRTFDTIKVLTEKRMVAMLTDPNAGINFSEENIKEMLRIAYANVPENGDMFSNTLLSTGKIFSECGNYTVYIYGGRYNMNREIHIVHVNKMVK